MRPDLLGFPIEGDVRRRASTNVDRLAHDNDFIWARRCLMTPTETLQYSCHALFQVQRTEMHSFYSSVSCQSIANVYCEPDTEIFHFLIVILMNSVYISKC